MKNRFFLKFNDKNKEFSLQVVSKENSYEIAVLFMVISSLYPLETFDVYKCLLKNLNSSILVGKTRKNKTFKIIKLKRPKMYRLCSWNEKSQNT